MIHSTLEVQEALRLIGLYHGELDGDFGPLTREAVINFQRKNALAPDGVVGPKTDAELFPVIPDRDLVVSDDVAKAALANAGSVHNLWPRQKECFEKYGQVGENQVTLVLPWPMRVAWEKGKIIHQFSVHAKVKDSALRCFTRIGKAYSDAQRAELGINLWGGCLNVRKMRGGSSYSMHSWGIAIDFDPERNQLKWNKAKARLARPDAETFWKIWEDEGWVSLGRSRDYDWMHVQAARL